MSVRAIAWALEVRGLTAPERLVLVVLADHANDDGYCYPGLQSVSEKVELEERSVRRHVARLERKGFLERLARFRPDGSQSSNGYRLPLSERVGRAAPPTPPGTPVPSPRAASSALPDTAGLPPRTSLPPLEPSFEPSGEPKQKNLGRVPAKAAHLAELLLDRILERDPGFTQVRSERNREAWLRRSAEAIDALHRLGEVPWTRIENGIEWSQRHPFYSTLVLSGESLRRHWDAMAARAREERAKQSRGAGG